MTVHCSERRDATDRTEVIVALAGSLDSASAASLETRLDAALESSPSSLVFDLGGLRFVTSAGIRVLLVAAKRQKARQGRTFFIHLQPEVREVFTLMGLAPDLQVFADRAELDAHLASSPGDRN